MSYIINTTNPFVSTKLTEKGREKLSKGELTFNSWAIGDSEINYDRAILSNTYPLDEAYSRIDKIMKPKDRQPNIKYFVNNGSLSPLNTLQQSNIKTMKIVVNNEATERGFFEGVPDSYVTLTGTPYTILNEIIPASSISGGTSFDIGVTGATEGNLILIKCGGNINGNAIPVPHLWFKAQTVSGSTIDVDRELPNLTLTGSVQVIVYDGGEIADSSFSENNTTAYWDTGTLSFDSSCDITREDVPIFNMNSVFMETILGISGVTYEDYSRYGSYEYIGLGEQYLELGQNNSDLNNPILFTCDEITGIGGFDGFNKSFAVIHYTNNTISNLYGEFFYIDNSNNKQLKVHMPDLMYHRRDSVGSGSGTTMGMTFVSNGDIKTVGTSDIQYYDLIENPSLILDGTPLVVGKVYPQLKIVVFEDAEIIACMSYKSNRNWTLPGLITNLTAPSGGTSTGVLQNGETMYITYGIENSSGSGYTSALPSQKYGRIKNTLSTGKDVQFRLEGTNLLPYMKKIESVGYDDTGFYGYEFKVIYQIVGDDSRPTSDGWKELDYTSTNITGGLGETIDPLLLESQNSNDNNQVITILDDALATPYNLVNKLNLAPILLPEILQFGDERFFYGNIETYIGATIYKTIFDIRIDSSQFIKTTNPTRSSDITTNPPNIKVSEIGIYDNDNELVLIGKLSEPLELGGGNSIMVELSIDF